jgi:hypothetical protein
VSYRPDLAVESDCYLNHLTNRCLYCDPSNIALHELAKAKAHFSSSVISTQPPQTSITLTGKEVPWLNINNHKNHKKDLRVTDPPRLTALFEGSSQPTPPRLMAMVEVYSQPRHISFLLSGSSLSWVILSV